MDPLAISTSFAAILARLSSLTLNTLELIRRTNEGNSELESQVGEIEVLYEVLKECNGIIQTSQNTKIPPSVEQALRICNSRYEELQDCMKAICDLWTARSSSKSRIAKLRMIKPLLLTETERKAAFSAFGSIAILLRDLCSE